MNINKYYILVTEGVTDCSLLEAMFEKYLGFVPFDNIKDLPALFIEMIGKYPTVSGELKRQDSPTFYYKGDSAIAIKQANGYSEIPNRISQLIENIDKLELYNEFAGFLIFCDTDLKTKKETEDLFTQCFADRGIEYRDNKLKVYANELNCFLHLFPSNGEGAVEKLLLQCAQVSYDRLFLDAEEFRKKIMDDEYQALRKECWASDKNIQQFYSDKVQFGAMSAVLKPDRPVRFTIKDKIIRTSFFNEYMQIPEFEKLHNFLVNTVV